MYKTQKLKVHFIFYRPYGNPACKECNGFCPGHDMKPEELFAKHSHETIRTSPPPTEVLKELFDRGNTEGVAAKVLFPQNEARPCYVHLQYVYFVVTLHFPFPSQGIQVVPASSNYLSICSGESKMRCKGNQD